MVGRRHLRLKRAAE